MPTLTLAQILTDMETAERGLTAPELARLYGVSSSSVASKLADLYQQRRIDRLRTRRRDEVTGRLVTVYAAIGSHVEVEQSAGTKLPRTVETERLLAAVLAEVERHRKGTTAAAIGEALGMRANHVGLYLARLRNNGRVFAELRGESDGMLWLPTYARDVDWPAPTVSPIRGWARAAAQGLRLA